METDDHVVSVLPVHLSNNLAPNLQLHQFPLLNRSLEVPPSATLSGKRIRARLKPTARRLEVHVPVDHRPEEDDKEKNQLDSNRVKENEEPRLSEVRFRSEAIPHVGAYMLGVVRNGALHLHPLTETHQLRPTLTYLDALNRKSRRARGADSDSESDDGPPPDPDEVPPISTPPKAKGPVGGAKEVQVTARKVDEKGGQHLQGGLSAVRREMLMGIRAEEEDEWQELAYHGPESAESNEAYEALFSQCGEVLESQSNVSTFLSSIRGR
ncbi:DNA-directed RNA polymerase III subunit Rpc5 [Lactarius hatsudake]|nr:DNA-directed RNA polymerase III subunit Rpc5 [Lactarius hatsudake]